MKYTKIIAIVVLTAVLFISGCATRTPEQIAYERQDRINRCVEFQQQCVAVGGRMVQDGAVGGGMTQCSASRKVMRCPVFK